jgi:Arc/MetJ-type ribon-helix-helix transcriptional regulator
MTIHVSKDAENAINAAVQSGKFASAAEMVDRLVREYIQRTRQQTAPAQSLPANASDSAPDPILGLMRDDTELMDEIVADAYRHRREESWRELDI